MGKLVANIDSYGSYPEPNKSRVDVLRVTKTGVVVLVNGDRYRPHGIVDVAGARRPSYKLEGHRYAGRYLRSIEEVA